MKEYLRMFVENILGTIFCAKLSFATKRDTIVGDLVFGYLPIGIVIIVWMASGSSSCAVEF